MRTESEAFQKFLDVFPEGSVLLIDTYNVRSAIQRDYRRRAEAGGRPAR